MVKIGVGGLECIRGNCQNGNGILGGMLVRLNPCPHVDLEDSPCREVRPVPHSRVQLFGRVETCFESGNDQVEWGVVVRVTVKPSDGARKTYGRVDGLRIGYVSKDPAHAACMVCVLSLDAFHIPYTDS